MHLQKWCAILKFTCWLVMNFESYITQHYPHTLTLATQVLIQQTYRLYMYTGRCLIIGLLVDWTSYVYYIHYSVCVYMLHSSEDNSHMRHSKLACETHWSHASHERVGRWSDLNELCISKLLHHSNVLISYPQV